MIRRQGNSEHCYNLVPRAFPLKTRWGGKRHPFFKGKALGTRLNIVIVKVTSRWTSACTVRYVAAIIVTQQHDLFVLSRSYTVYRGVGASPLKSYFRRVYVRKVLRVQICLLSEYSLSSIYSQWKGALIPGKSPSPEGTKKVP